MIIPSHLSCDVFVAYLADDSIPGVGSDVGSLIPVDGPQGLFPDLHGLPDPVVVFVTFGADDFGLFPVHVVVLFLAVVAYGSF